MATYLADTNILVYLVNLQEEKKHKDTIDAIRALLQRGDVLCVGPQNIIEFWSVATRTGPNGLSWPPQRAGAFFALFINNRLFRLLVEPANLLEAWYQFCLTNSVIGPRCYDARLVALMNQLGISNILTYNTKHFATFPNITAVDPASI